MFTPPRLRRSMAPPTEQQTKLWEHSFNAIPFNDQFKTPTRLRLVDLDPLPPPDAQDRRFVSGWKARWEGVIEEGEFSRVGPGVKKMRDVDAGIPCAGWGNFGGTMHGAVTAWIVDTSAFPVV